MFFCVISALMSATKGVEISDSFLCHRVRNTLNVRSCNGNKVEHYFVQSTIVIRHVLINIKISFMFFALVKNALCCNSRPKI